MNGTADGNVDDGEDETPGVVPTVDVAEPMPDVEEAEAVKVVDAIGVITMGEVVEVVVEVLEAVAGGIVGVGTQGCGN
jgi:hypothetical protein